MRAWTPRWSIVSTVPQPDSFFFFLLWCNVALSLSLSNSLPLSLPLPIYLSVLVCVCVCVCGWLQRDPRRMLPRGVKTFKLTHGLPQVCQAISAVDKVFAAMGLQQFYAVRFPSSRLPQSMSSWHVLVHCRFTSALLLPLSL